MDLVYPWDICANRKTQIRKGNGEKRNREYLLPLGHLPFRLFLQLFLLSFTPSSPAASNSFHEGGPPFQINDVNPYSRNEINLEDNFSNPIHVMPVRVRTADAYRAGGVRGDDGGGG